MARPRRPAHALLLVALCGGGLLLSACGGQQGAVAPRRRRPAISASTTTSPSITAPSNTAPSRAVSSSSAVSSSPSSSPSATTAAASTSDARASTTSRPAPASTTPPAEKATPSTAAGAGASRADPIGDLPQTTALPSGSSPQFIAAMHALFAAITSGVAKRAKIAFFPESAYLRLKAISDPATDYSARLVADYDADIEAAHRFLGQAAARATFAAVSVPASEAAWIPPGYCYNSIGYWHDPGARLDYRVGGQLRSIGIASLISWRGEWYVVHLGAVLRSGDAGIVDSPALGAGVPGAPGGC